MSMPAPTSREPARLLVDLDVEAGLQQADRGGEPADAAADDRNGNVLARHRARRVTRRACRAPGRSRRTARRGRPAENGASGGLTRASAGSAWICASSDFTPETSGLPSNSLRIVTAASSAALSPLLQARWQRSALRLAVAEMQPANAPSRASISTASVEGNTSKLLRDRRGLPRIGHVAGGNPSGPRCGCRSCRAGASPARRASAGRTAAGSDRGRSGSACRAVACTMVST